MHVWSNLKKICCLGVVVGICVFSIDSFAQTIVKNGPWQLSKYSCSHKENIVETLIELANDGDAEAAFCLGNHFGWVENVDRAEVLKWHLKGAELGSRKSQSLIAEYFEETEKDMKKAFHWRKKAAWQGDEGSLMWLAIMSYWAWIQSKDEQALIDARVFQNLSGFVHVPHPWGKGNVCLESVLTAEQLARAAEDIKKFRAKKPDVFPVENSAGKDFSNC